MMRDSRQMRSSWRGFAVVGLCTAVVVGMLSLVSASSGDAAGHTARGPTNSVGLTDDLAAQSTVGSPQDANSTRGFHFYNSTGYDAQFSSSVQTGNVPCGSDVLDGGGPSIGTVLHPGASLDFEVIYHFQATTWCTVTFNVLNDKNVIAQFGINFGVNGDYSPYAQTDTSRTTQGWTLNIHLEDNNQSYTNISLLPYLPPLPTVHPATWMHDIASEIQNRKLTDIVIPASHDSTTYTMGDYRDKLAFAVTQSEDLTAQLNSGMREFDIRVKYHNGNYDAHHGPQFSNLTLASILSDIGNWATTSGHEQEIIMLNLSIDDDNGADPFPTGDCQSFGQQLGEALMTPNELEDHGILSSDPGAVSLGVLWSLPDPKGAARVIMDSSRCMDAARPDAGQWSSAITGGLFNGYYADQCTADGNPGQEDQESGITNRVLHAVQERLVNGDGAEPTGYGPVKQGGVYLIGIGGTPELDCLITPFGLLVQEQKVLAALYQQWQTDPAIRANLNVISGDFVERTDLMKDVICLDTWRKAGC